jgi:hypothetical protein
MGNKEARVTVSSVSLTFTSSSSTPPLTILLLSTPCSSPQTYTCTEDA